MRTLLTLFAVSVVVFFLAAPAAAQSPVISIYFDDDFTFEDKDCPTGGGVDTAYVVAENFDAFLLAVEFLISYPSTMTWLADLDTPPVTIGDTPSGISMGWGSPQNGFEACHVSTILFTWNCNGCGVENDPIVVQPNPWSGKVQASTFPDHELIEATGMTSLVCSTVPVEETTWGSIKALYVE